MKFLVACVLLAAAVQAHRIDEEDEVPDFDIRQPDLRREFASFVRSHRRSRGALRSNAEVKKRYNVFVRNAQKIKEHNQHDNKYFRMGVNDFADKTLRERALYTGLANATTLQRARRSSLQLREAAPEAYDHRDHGHVTRVSNQGECGSCWTYGTVYPLEGAVSIALGKKAVELSQQEILSCAYEEDEDRNGCNGGWYMDGWDYTKKTGHLALARDVPYDGIDMHCDPDIMDEPNGLKGVKVTGWEQVPSGNDKALALAASKHVVAVAIESLGLFFYEAGIFRDEYCETPAAVDHAVTMVGYSTEAWIIKNSWGPEWGEHGYVRVARDIPSHCGVADYSYYPIVEKKKEEDKSH